MNIKAINFGQIIMLMRPHQYVKNLFIFTPLFFDLQFTNTNLLIQAFVAFVAFSFAASGIYIINDYLDIEEDKKHPKKCKRPLASGAVSVPVAKTVMVLLFFIAGGMILALSPEAGVILLAYVLMNFAYSYRLKHIAILDVTIISIGFILRLFVGSVVTGVTLSMWIVIMTFLLALFMALAKRRDDILVFMDTGKRVRKVIDGYNLKFLDTAMAIMAAVVIVAYILYTNSTAIALRDNGELLYLTSLFVIVGILRYLQITYVEEASGSPTRILIKDRFMQLDLLAWVAVFFWILYL